MNFDESVVFNYLTNEFFENIMFEPDGNIPPDFLIDNAIAIEARRLNQHVIKKGQATPLETSEYNIIPKIRNLFTRFKTSNNRQSSFVSISYRSPLKIIKQIENQILDVLKSKSTRLESRESFLIDNNLRFDFHPSSKQDGKLYRLGSYIDKNWGGVIVSELIKNIKICVSSKEKKISPYKERYDIWWLALVDHIGFDLNEEDAKSLKRHFKIDTFFDKVLIISPYKPYNGIVVKG